MATLAGCDKADKVSDTTKKPVIKIGSDNYPPYNFLNEDGIPTGIDVELATEAFRRMGYKTEIVQINWEKKKELVESGKIDCIMGCFSMEGRLNDYRWAGPYIASRQVVAVNENSDIHKLSDLKGKNLAVQSTSKPEGIFLKRTDKRIPKLGNLISLGHMELIYTFLGKGYVDAVAAHEESIVQYMKDYDTSFRIFCCDKKIFPIVNISPIINRISLDVTLLNNIHPICPISKNHNAINALLIGKIKNDILSNVNGSTETIKCLIK